MCTFFDEALGCGQAHATVTACDDCNLTVQLSHNFTFCGVECASAPICTNCAISGSLIRIHFNYMWITDPLVKEIYASRRQKKLHPSTCGRSRRRHRAWCRCVHARYRPPGQRGVGHTVSPFPNSRSLVRSIAAYECG